jgi:coenzyme F420-0:L-glutamate ligase/coenzyme F420-1:gamma-L-glutamate ligase
VSHSNHLEIIALQGLPRVHPGDSLAGLIDESLARGRLALRRADVVVVAQKIVSKAEGRLVDLATVKPGAKARRLAVEVRKDPRLVELILSESTRIVRKRPHVLIVEHRLGFVMANAGVDQSNTLPMDGHEWALLLPLDPDASARRLRAALARKHGPGIGVVINDSFGRAWRQGTMGVAIGAAGLPSLLDLRGRPDLFGRTLQVSMVGYADEVAAAASLVMGQAGEGQPAVVVRGLRRRGSASPASTLIRPSHEDLFR